MTEKEELKNRIKAKQHELEARFEELKADSRAEAREERDKLRTRLNELQEAIKGGWDNITDRVAAKLNDWLKRN